VAGSAANLAGRFGALTLLSALSTIAITRLLGPSGYGVYGSAVATAAVLGAIADFGFSMMLSRDMAEDASSHRPLLRAAYEVASGWSLVLALVMVAMAFSAPISSKRGLALLVLAPSMAFNGLNPARAFFLVTYQTGRLVRIDLLTALLQLIATVVVAASKLGPVAVTATVSAGSIVNNVVVAAVVARMLEPGSGSFSRRVLVRRAAPLGALSIMTKVYLTIDLVLLGWYVTGTRLGDYAAASKLLTVIAGLSGAVMAGALPALSREAGARRALNELGQRIWHWLMVGALPIFLALGLFAPLFVELSVGHRYRGAIPLIRILSIAGAVTVMSNLAGNLMVALRRMRSLFIQNSLAIVVNITGNVVLIPRYGVYAAAWMTVATEVLVCGASLFSLRRDLSFSGLARVSLRPALAALISAIVALPLLQWQWIAATASAVVFLASVTVLRAWPSELRRLRWFPSRVAEAWRFGPS